MTFLNPQSWDSCCFRHRWTLKVHLSKCKMRTMWCLPYVVWEFQRKPLFSHTLLVTNPYHSHTVTENHWNKILHCPAMIKKYTIHPWTSVSIVTEQWQPVKCPPAESWVTVLNFCHVLTLDTCLLCCHLLALWEINMLAVGRTKQKREAIKETQNHGEMGKNGLIIKINIGNKLTPMWMQQMKASKMCFWRLPWEIRVRSRVLYMLLSSAPQSVLHTFYILTFLFLFSLIWSSSQQHADH